MNRVKAGHWEGVWPTNGDRDPLTDHDDLPTIDGLDSLVRLLDDVEDQTGSGKELYVRWSLGPATDLAGDHEAGQSSRDALTGIALPGLSANPLGVERWWGSRPLRLWVARRLYDYRHLRDLRGPGVRPWVLLGEQCGRGPDNEPLVVCHRPLAWVSERALREADRVVEEQASTEWGPLDRASMRSSRDR